MTVFAVSIESTVVDIPRRRTVQADDAEDEDQRQNKDDDGVDLQTGRLISVQL